MKVTTLVCFIVCSDCTNLSPCFPSFQSDCSGSNSCIEQLSEWIDSFLKAAAQKLLPYVRDTTSFIKCIKIETLAE